MTEVLQEFCDWRGVALRVDRPASVIRGVKILGLESRNGRVYLPEALAQAARLYEEAKVNVNHSQANPAGPRDYRDRIGLVRNVAVRDGEGLFADFHFNPKHALAEQFLWDAEHVPENVGFSHNVQAQTSRRGDRVVVESISRVLSVDLVADPATTRGLFESRAPGSQGPASQNLSVQSVADLRCNYPELVEALLQEQTTELTKLRAEVQRLEAAEAARQKHEAIRRLLREFQLPEPDAADPRTSSMVGPQFLAQLASAPNEQAMRALVEERAGLVRALAGQSVRETTSGKPLSRDQYQVYGAADLDAKSFVEAIT